VPAARARAPGRVVLLTPRFAPRTSSACDARACCGSTRARSASKSWPTTASRAWCTARVTPRGAPALGHARQRGALTLEDVRAFWSAHARPRARARLVLVGEAERRGASRSSSPISPGAGRGARAPARPSASPAAARRSGPAPAPDRQARRGPERAAPRAPRVASTDPDFYPLQALNHVLGGAFSSRLNLNLREDKGYTYGVRSRFEGGSRPGRFLVSCRGGIGRHRAGAARGAQGAVAIRAGVSAGEADFARSSMARALGRSLESTQARLAWLENVARYGYPVSTCSSGAWRGSRRARAGPRRARAPARSIPRARAPRGGGPQGVARPAAGPRLGEVRSSTPAGASLVRPRSPETRGVLAVPERAP
jgi:hypothetical protein